MTATLTAPRILTVPDYGTSAGREATELAAMAGLVLDPWQADVLEQALGEAPDGTWAATEVGLCVPRQNGKDAILEARELAALFLFRESLTLHSAHLFKTAQEHFLRLVERIDGCDELRRQVKRVSRAHGEEGITLLTGERIAFSARTKGAGRGFSAPLVIFNEAMMLPEAALGALLPTQAAMPNRQRWYAGSAVDQFVHEHGVVFARVRDRATRGDDPRLAYFEWSLDEDDPARLDEETLGDEAVWERSNPGYGIRIAAEAVEDELRAMDRRTFAVERLGVGDWPPVDAAADQVIPVAVWDACAERAVPPPTIMDPVAFAFDVSPLRSWSSISAAGLREDGNPQVEVVAHREGTNWVVAELARLRERHQTLGVFCGGSSPAESLVHLCNEAGFDVEVVSTADHAKACGLLYDLAHDRRLRHLGSDELRSAVRGAARKPYGDSWLWSRKNAAADISPLVSATLAVWASSTLGWDWAGDPRIW